MGEKSLDAGENVAERQSNRENERSQQNARTRICIFSNVNQRHCTNICNMNVKGRLGIEWVDRLLVKRLNYTS